MFTDRRTALKAIGTAGAGIAVGWMPLAKALSNDDQDYVDACGMLVGVPGSVLEPTNEPGKLAPGFRGLAQEGVRNGIKAMEDWLATYRKAAAGGKKPDDIAEELMAANGPLSRLSMKLWLYGMWLGTSEPEDTVSYHWYGNNTLDDFVVSSVAYRRGWVWRMGQAKPMGYSRFTLNSWGSAPPSLDQYLMKG